MAFSVAARAAVDVHRFVLVLHLILFDMGRDVDAQAPERASDAGRVTFEVHRFLAALNDRIDAQLALSDAGARGQVEPKSTRPSSRSYAASFSRIAQQIAPIYPPAQPSCSRGS